MWRNTWYFLKLYRQLKFRSILRYKLLICRFQWIVFIKIFKVIYFLLNLSRYLDQYCGIGFKLQPIENLSCMKVYSSRDVLNPSTFVFCYLQQSAQGYIFLKEGHGLHVTWLTCPCQMCNSAYSIDTNPHAALYYPIKNYRGLSPNYRGERWAYVHLIRGAANHPIIYLSSHLRCTPRSLKVCLLAHFNKWSTYE